MNYLTYTVYPIPMPMPLPFNSTVRTSYIFVLLSDNNFLAVQQEREGERESGVVTFGVHGKAICMSFLCEMMEGAVQKQQLLQLLHVNRDGTLNRTS